MNSVGSFALPRQQWRDLETELRPRLDAIERHRREFPELEARIRRLSPRLRHLGPSSSAPPAAPGSALEAVAHRAEVLSFALRHGQGDSFARYREVLRRIRDHHDELRISTSLIRTLHRDVIGESGGCWKEHSNFIKGVSTDGVWLRSDLTVHPSEVDESMETLHADFAAARAKREFDPVMILAAYLLDLFVIHPFLDGNGRVARLMFLLLLYQSGHRLGDYVSLEAELQRRNAEYYLVLFRSEKRWSLADRDPAPWTRFVTDVLLDGYTGLHERVDRLELLADHSESISACIGSLPKRFRGKDLAARLPEVPAEVLALVLHRACAAGRLEATPTPGGLEWRRVS